MSCTMRVHQRLLPPGPEAAKEARDFLSQATCEIHTSRVADDAVLLVSELVGNAVRHGLPPIEIQVRCAGEDALEVRVRDGDDSKIEADIGNDDAEGGRGLALVDLLSETWGVDHEGDGKTVWFRVKV